MQTDDETSKSISQVHQHHDHQHQVPQQQQINQQQVSWNESTKQDTKSSSKGGPICGRQIELLLYLIPKQMAELAQLLSVGHQLLIELRTNDDKKIAITRMDRKTQVHRAKLGNKQGAKQQPTSTVPSRYYALKLRVPDVGKPAKMILRWNSNTQWLLDFCYLRSEQYE